MIYKKNFFSVLEDIEIKKIEKEIINIKSLYLKKKQNTEQIKLLINYQKEYSKKIYNKMTSGICIHKWKNYNNFIKILETIIEDNVNRIEKNKKIIEDNLKKLSKNQMKQNVWKHLNIKYKKKIFKTKKIQQEIIDDSYIQLKFFKKGQVL
ncbi:flagellar export protein FliJ [Buchnera aphidicola (Sitobion avenae)]|uniref:Flagellar FliJ protein n=1 Tax=Buchnera aphidicola (Sitobion avenae) TaxID=571428 RepID=A0A4D6YHS6_9GAMM|nr:flagellar FliJ family protein [Buchnera aphidicola]QCI25310.1 flagellar export protein FliJ [Buchnera aphidicola (Sitobion avenae)]